MLRDAQAAPPARRGVDVVTYSAAIAACRNAGEWKQALSLMEVTRIPKVPVVRQGSKQLCRRMSLTSMTSSPDPKINVCKLKKNGSLNPVSNPMAYQEVWSVYIVYTAIS